MPFSGHGECSSSKQTTVDVGRKTNEACSTYLTFEALCSVHNTLNAALNLLGKNADHLLDRRQSVFCNASQVIHTRGLWVKAGSQATQESLGGLQKESRVCAHVYFAQSGSCRFTHHQWNAYSRYCQMTYRKKSSCCQTERTWTSGGNSAAATSFRRLVNTA